MNSNILIIYVAITGADPGFSEGGAKLTQWRWIGHLSSQTYGMARHYFKNFSKWRAKKKKKKTKTKKKVPTYCYLHYGPSPNLFATTRPSMWPSSTIAVRQRLSKLTEEHDLPVPLSTSKTLDRGAINLEGGAEAPPLNPPLHHMIAWNDEVASTVQRKYNTIFTQFVPQGYYYYLSKY